MHSDKAKETERLRPIAAETAQQLAEQLGAGKLATIARANSPQRTEVRHLVG
jgi:hypothetical protein